MHTSALTLAECLGPSTDSIPEAFCWAKVAWDDEQSTGEIIRRKELERQAGEGVFAWGIGNAIEGAARSARALMHPRPLEVLFTGMRQAPKPVISSSASRLLWLGYYLLGSDELRPLPTSMVITSRNQPCSVDDRRGRYALICMSPISLSESGQAVSISNGRLRNLVSTRPVATSQMTSVVRHDRGALGGLSYSLLFRASLVEVIRLAAPVSLTRELLSLHEATLLSKDGAEWRQKSGVLKATANRSWSRLDVPPTSWPKKLD